jgi:hypothetical protein
MDPRSFRILSSEEWQILADVSEKLIGPICKGKAVKEDSVKNNNHRYSFVSYSVLCLQRSTVK